MSKRATIRPKIRFAVAVIGLCVLLLDAALGMALLVKGIPRQVVWQAGRFVEGPVPWTYQDTVILAALLLLQPSVFVFCKVVHENRARAKAGSIE